MERTYRMYIDGEWVDADSGEEMGIINPVDGEAFATTPYGSVNETRRAIQAAERAFPAWAKKTVYERAEYLKRVAALMRENVREIATDMTKEVGKPLSESLAEVNGSADQFEWYAEEAKRNAGEWIPSKAAGKRYLTLRHPVGVVAAIAPWNFPVVLMCRKVAPALAAGCTVVGRPATQTPLATMGVFDCIHEAGLPNGVANLVTGRASDLGNEFMTNPTVRKISFTGSVPVGKDLMRAASDQLKRLSLELGGHSPFMVCPDMPPKESAAIAVAGKFRNMGQVCISPSRFYVHEEVLEEFQKEVVKIVSGLKIGDGLDETVDVGPLFEQRVVDNTVGFLEDIVAKGGEILYGGQKPEGPQYDKGFFFTPTVVTGITRDMRVVNEEPFCPIMPIMSFKDNEEALKAANDTPFGLAAYVLTRDLKTALTMAEGLEAGVIGVNDISPAAAQCPFGGMKESGIGREGSHEGLHAYMELKYVSFLLVD